MDCENIINMKIVNIIGGLGNQMFQYAFAVALKKNYPNEQVYIDTQHFKYLFINHYKSCHLHNGYELNKIFSKTDIPVASAKDIIKISQYIPNYFLSRVSRRLFPCRKSEYIERHNYIFYPEVFKKKESCYFEGYWQSAKYFMNAITEIRDCFEFDAPNKYNTNMCEQICSSSSVGIHVRRGDYLLDPEYKGLCELDYYERAIKKIDTSGKHFFIFSNDIVWCRNNLLCLFGESNVTFVDGNKGANSAWDMFLMSQCDELIIANSSFSWWGAFLNKKATKIIAPKKWINRDYEADVYLDNWLKV